MIILAFCAIIFAIIFIVVRSAAEDAKTYDREG